MKCWGYATHGLLGLGFDSGILGGSASQMGDNLPFVDLGFEQSAVMIDASRRHTCAFLNNSKIKCWGLNSAGRLGLGDGDERGDNPGEMGDILPFLDFGTDLLGQDLLVLHVSTGSDHSCVLLSNLKVKCWGSGSHGRTGYGNTLDRGDVGGQMGNFLPEVSLGNGLVPVAVEAGGSHSCALFTNGRVKCWGSNVNGQLGYDDGDHRGDDQDEMGDLLDFVDFGVNRTVRKLVCGNIHSCVILENYELKCWGLNDEGQLGYGDQLPRGSGPSDMGDNLLPIDLGPGRSAVDVFIGHKHTCAHLDNGQLKCWGDNTFGILGLEIPQNMGDDLNEMGVFLPPVDLGSGKTAQQVRLGYEHSCALLDTGEVKCWGKGTNGLLGLGDKISRGGDPGEMGDVLPAVNLGSTNSTLQPTVLPPEPTETPTSTFAPSVSPSTSTPSGPTTEVPTMLPSTSPTLKGAATEVGRRLLQDNAEGGGNGWTDEELRRLEAEDITTRGQLCALSAAELSAATEFTSGRAAILRNLFACDSSNDNSVLIDVIIPLLSIGAVCCIGILADSRKQQITGPDACKDCFGSRSQNNNLNESVEDGEDDVEQSMSGKTIVSSVKIDSFEEDNEDSIEMSRNEEQEVNDKQEEAEV